MAGAVGISRAAPKPWAARAVIVQMMDWENAGEGGGA